MADESQPNSTAGCLLHLLWTLVGPGLLFATGALLIVEHPKIGSWPDFVLLGLTLLIVFARLVDRTPAASTPGGGTDVANTSRWKYVFILVGLVALTFAIAHFVTPRIF